MNVSSSSGVSETAAAVATQTVSPVVTKNNPARVGLPVSFSQ